MAIPIFPAHNTPDEPLKKPSNKVENKVSPRKKVKIKDSDLPDVFPASEKEEDSDWAVDPKTGRKYKKLASAPPEAVEAFRRGKGKGLSKEELEKYTKLDEDFDLDDLTATADTFLAHLRVPPNKEEQEALKQDRINRKRAQDSAYKSAQKFLEDKDNKKKRES